MFILTTGSRLFGDFFLKTSKRRNGLDLSPAYDRTGTDFGPATYLSRRRVEPNIKGLLIAVPPQPPLVGPQ
jgi:hypothetical protein